MFFLGRFASKLTIWLTALAMPLQAGWVSACGCSSASESVVSATSPAPNPPGHCCRAATSKTSCCETSKPQPTCCGSFSEPDQQAGCQCGAACRCIDRDDSPAEPPVRAPADGRSQSVVELTVSLLAATGAAVADGNTSAVTAEPDSTFYLPGAQLCVLLCRFTL